MSTEYKLKGGVIIIGSLYWQNSLGDGNFKTRKIWRDTHLNIEESIRVNVPIRYGRFSGSKKDGNQTYTMVFDDRLPLDKYGQAKVVPFKADINNWTTLDHEVRALSKVEGEGETYIKGDHAWCVCSILFNPTIGLKVRSEILKKWKLQLRSNVLGYKEFIKNPYVFSLNSNGELSIQWPPELSGLDFLIATSTRPTKSENNTYEIDAHEIAAHVKNRKYFYPNIYSGITTFQDKAIYEELVLIDYQYKLKSDVHHRFRSWVHCINAFNSKENVEFKALHLAFYLASWGMYRGSSGLLQKDYKIHIGAIKILQSKEYSALHCSSTHEISKNQIALILSLKERLFAYYSSIPAKLDSNKDQISPTDTLLSKIIHGTLACVPAYDRFFITGLKHFNIYHKHFDQEGIDEFFNLSDQLGFGRIKSKINSLDFVKDLGVNYSLMKVVDMYFWQFGFNIRPQPDIANKE